MILLKELQNRHVPVFFSLFYSSSSHYRKISYHLQQRLVQLFQEAEFLRYKLEVLRADYDALMTRKEFVKRNAAQTKRERALATQRRYDPKDVAAEDHRDAGGFSSEDSDDD